MRLNRFHGSGGEKRSQAGFMLMELMLSMVLLTVGVLGFLYCFQMNFKATGELIDRDLESAMLTNVVKKLEKSNFYTLFTDYHGTSVAASETQVSSNLATATFEKLKDLDGNQAQVLVNFFVDETTLPSEFGPIMDLDGDGLLSTTTYSENYRLLPARLTLFYRGANGPRTSQVFMTFKHRER